MESEPTRADMKVLEGAVRNGWALPAEIREGLGSVMANVVASGTNRERVAAARVLVAMWIAGWTVPEPVLKNLATIMGTIAATGTNRERVGASRVLIAIAKAGAQSAKRPFVIYQGPPDQTEGEDDFTQRKRRLAARIAGRG